MTRALQWVFQIQRLAGNILFLFILCIKCVVWELHSHLFLSEPRFIYQGLCWIFCFIHLFKIFSAYFSMKTLIVVNVHCIFPNWRLCKLMQCGQKEKQLNFQILFKPFVYVPRGTSRLCVFALGKNTGVCLKIRQKPWIWKRWGQSQWDVSHSSSVRGMAHWPKALATDLFP